MKRKPAYPITADLDANGGRITQLETTVEELKKEVRIRQMETEELKKEVRNRVQEELERPSPILGERRRDGKWPHVFVLMPLADKLRPVYQDHIKKVVKKVGTSKVRLQVGRADDFFTNGQIMSDIWSAINAARIVIADCTGRNPNVFYEIGLAHAIGKSTILIAQSLDDIPFDLRALRFIIYDPLGMKKFETDLAATMRSAL